MNKKSPNLNKAFDKNGIISILDQAMNECETGYNPEKCPPDLNLVHAHAVGYRLLSEPRKSANRISCLTTYNQLN